MRLRLTFLLLALNGALLSLILYLERAQSTSELLENSSRSVINADFLAGLSRITVSGVDSDARWILEKRGESWFVQSPHDWRANAFAVDQLLFDLNRLRWDSSFAVADLALSGQTLASYGLDQPAVTMELADTDSALTLAFGSSTEIGGRLYVLSPDQKDILVVDQKSLGFLGNQARDLLNPDVFSLRPEEIRAFQIQDRLVNNTRVRLERKGSSWAFVSPVQTSANPEAVAALLDQWSFLQTDAFLDPETAFPDAAQESLRLVLESVGQREILLLKGPDEPGGPYIGKRDGYATAFEVDPILVEALRSVQGDLREKRVLRPHADDWSSIEIQFGDLNISLQQLESGAWQVLHTDDQGNLRSDPADPDAIEQVRTLMKAMEARGFVTDAPSTADLERFGLNEPQRLILFRKKDGQAVSLSIGGVLPDRDRTLLYAKLDTAESVFLVRPDLLTTFSLDPYGYRDRTLFALPEGAVIESVVLKNTLLDEPLNLDSSPVLENLLTDLVRLTRVQRLWSTPFANPLQLSDGRIVEWPLELTATYLSPQSPESPRQKSFLLSPRIGGQTLLIGDPQSGLVGSLPEAFIDPIDQRLVTFPEPPSEEDIPPP